MKGGCQGFTRFSRQSNTRLNTVSFYIPCVKTMFFCLASNHPPTHYMMTLYLTLFLSARGRRFFLDKTMRQTSWRVAATTGTWLSGCGRRVGPGAVAVIIHKAVAAAAVAAAAATILRPPPPPPQPKTLQPRHYNHHHGQEVFPPLGLVVRLPHVRPLPRGAVKGGRPCSPPPHREKRRSRRQSNSRPQGAPVGFLRPTATVAIMLRVGRTSSPPSWVRNGGRVTPPSIVGSLGPPTPSGRRLRRQVEVCGETGPRGG